MRSVPSTDSSRHERPGCARARYAEIGVRESAINSRVTAARLRGSSVTFSIAEIPHVAALLHQLQDGEFRSIAGAHARFCDARVTAAALFELGRDLLDELLHDAGVEEVLC